MKAQSMHLEYEFNDRVKNDTSKRSGNSCQMSALSQLSPAPLHLISMPAVAVPFVEEPTCIHKGVAANAGFGDCLHRQREVQRCGEDRVQVAAQVVVPPLRIRVTILQQVASRHDVTANARPSGTCLREELPVTEACHQPVRFRGIACMRLPEHQSALLLDKQKPYINRTQGNYLAGGAAALADGADAVGVEAAQAA